MKEIRLCDNHEREYTIGLCNKYNLAIEIQSFSNPYVENKQKIIEEYTKMLPETKIGRSYHAPFWDLNLGTKIKELQDTMMKFYNEAYSIAKKLNCTEIIIHANYRPGTDYYDGWINRAKAFLAEFLKDKDNSIIICLENQFESDSELFIRLIDELNDSRVKICLDIGHVNCNSNMSLEDWIKTLNTRIAQYHLHNNHGKQTVYGYNKDDEHLAINNGTIDIEEALNLAEKYTPDAIWSIESKPNYLEESVKCLKELGYI